MRHRFSVALGLALLGLAACGGRGTTPLPVGGADPAVADFPRLESETRRRMADDGLTAADVRIVTGEAWRSAAEGAGSMVEALRRAGLPGLRVEARGRSFCARAAESADCLFVSVVSASTPGPGVHEVGPAQVGAVALVLPGPPDDPDARMLWREELRTGRLMIFLTGWSGRGSSVVRKPAARSSSP